MKTKSVIISFLLFLAVVVSPGSAWAKIVIHSQAAVKIELLGYNGLTESSVFKGNLKAGDRQELNIPYRGLALLTFSEGQRYPVIIGDKSFTLEIAEPRKPPFFEGSDENNSFYKSLSGSALPPEQFKIAVLMIQAQDLLKSSSSVKTTKQLADKKKEFHEFVGEHYDTLKHSDMVRRFIAQYFIMQEYVDYQTEGVPANETRARYQIEVINGVGSWLNILKPHLPEQEILNYIVSLYYRRSMVTLSSLVIENFRNVAYCPGVKKQTFSFPEDMPLTEVDNTRTIGLADLKTEKIIAFVSDDCPVSMVETVSKMRRFVRKRENTRIIVAPLQPLSGNHLAMQKMLSNGKLLFVNDEKWRKTNLKEKIRLPLFVRLKDKDIRRMDSD